MGYPTSHNKGIAVERLEGRRMLSASPGITPDVTISSVSAVTVSASVGARFKGLVGTWATSDGLPAPGSGMTAVAIISWGDGKTSHGKFVDDGSGTIQINGVHTWAKSGTLQTVIHVEEIAKGHSHQITDLGQSTGEADVAPRPHALSLKGNFTGAYTTPVGNPDARSYEFTGSGNGQSVGAADLSGSITPPGFIKTGQAHGEFTLTSSGGTVTFDVTGHTQNGGGAVPEKLAYQIVDGTGGFAGIKGKGTISVALDDTAGTFVFLIH